MNTKLFCPVALLAASLIAAHAAPKDDITAAAKKLADAGNYSWTTDVDAGQFQFSSDGKVQKDGLVALTSTFGDNSTMGFAKGGKGAIKTDDGWVTLEDAAKDDGNGGFNPARGMAMRLKNFKAPDIEVVELAGDAASLTATNGVISGPLTDEAAKKWLSFRRRSADNSKNAKGDIKIWIKDGALVKYQLHVTGTVTFNDQDNDVERTSTTQIKNVGSTTVTVPDDAKGKMSS